MWKLCLNYFCWGYLYLNWMSGFTQTIQTTVWSIETKVLKYNYYRFPIGHVKIIEILTPQVLKHYFECQFNIVVMSLFHLNSLRWCLLMVLLNVLWLKIFPVESTINFNNYNSITVKSLLNNASTEYSMRIDKNYLYYIILFLF